MPEDATFRAWIPGCSTGEEVYSLLIILYEYTESINKRINFQLFGTDIDDNAIETARKGVYPSSIAADIDAKRLKRFFTKEGDYYIIRKEIRDSAVFSVQDLLKDPPFSRLNLLCCRNVLIYLDTSGQKKLLPLFHYTLNPGGILILGSSETIGRYSGMFETLNKKWKIFRRLESPPSELHQLEFPGAAATPIRNSPDKQPLMTHKDTDISKMAKNAILNELAPTSILVDANGDVLYIQGRTGKFLEPPDGPPTNNLINLVRDELKIDLSTALRAAKSKKKKASHPDISLKINNHILKINLHVHILDEPPELAGKFLVVFEEMEPQGEKRKPKRQSSKKSSVEKSLVRELESELQASKEQYQVTVEELVSSNEELKSTNEELQSSYEELQSTNEELESSKEELQSLNEELQTINAELESKVDELSAARDDMRNLLNSTEIATIFVDNQLRIRRFTSEAATIVNLIQTDIGRPLEHVKTNLIYDNMNQDLIETVKKLTKKEIEVQTVDKTWYSMRIVPYLTTDNRIDGAVLTFSIIDDQKKVQKKLLDLMQARESAQELVRNVFDMNKDPMLVLDNEGRMVIANAAFSRVMKVKQTDIEGKDVLDINFILPKGIKLSTKLKTSLKKGTGFKINEVKLAKSNRRKSFSLESKIVHKSKKNIYRILLHFKEKIV